MQRLSDFFHWIVTNIHQLADAWGAPGLFLIAFFDSSFLTLPEVADILVVMFTIREPDGWLYFAAMTTLGSLVGCYALYLVGRKGGEALVRKGFHERHIDWAMDWFRKHGTLVLILPAVLPPPMPFKLFVLMAGVSGVRSMPFVLSVAIGRGFRYGGEALLARWYGDAVVEFIQEDAPRFIWPTVGILVAAAAAWFVWRRYRGDRPPKADVE